MTKSKKPTRKAVPEPKVVKLKTMTAVVESAINANMLREIRTVREEYRIESERSMPELSEKEMQKRLKRLAKHTSRMIEKLRKTAERDIKEKRRPTSGELCRVLIEVVNGARYASRGLDLHTKRFSINARRGQLRSTERFEDLGRMEAFCLLLPNPSIAVYFEAYTGQKLNDLLKRLKPTHGVGPESHKETIRVIGEMLWRPLPQVEAFDLMLVKTHKRKATLVGVGGFPDQVAMFQVLLDAFSIERTVNPTPFHADRLVDALQSWELTCTRLSPLRGTLLVADHEEA